MMRGILFAWVLSATLLAHAQSPTDYSDAKRRADADEASLPAASASALRDAQGIALEAAIAGCATPTADTSPFVVVAELDASGKVVRTWRRAARRWRSACRSGSMAARCQRRRARPSSPLSS